MINPFDIDGPQLPTEWDFEADEAREAAAKQARQPAPAPLVIYDVNEAAISALAAECAHLSCDTTAGYEATRLAIGRSRTMRVQVDVERVKLKAKALAYGRAVDSEAKRITGLLLAVEAPLQANKDEVDAYKAQIKREKEEAETAALEFIIQQKREAEEAAAKAIRDAEQAQIDAARAALVNERAELAAARRVAEAVEDERRLQDQAERLVESARLKTEREALDAERRAVDEDRAFFDAERERAARVELELATHIEAQANAAAKDALLPDLEKARAWVASIRALTPPTVKAKKVSALLASTYAEIVHMLDGVKLS